jgi:hypothetical protein
MYYPSLMLMALHEERVCGFDRRAFQADLRLLEPGWARRNRAAAWPTWALAALSGRSRAAARRAGLASARAAADCLEPRPSINRAAAPRLSRLLARLPNYARLHQLQAIG